MMQKRSAFGALAGLAAALGKLFAAGPALIAAAILISPEGPHIRLGMHRSSYGQGVRSCSYLGSRGIVEPYDNGGCPFFLWLDRRER